jgi:hypothetical protein
MRLPCERFAEIINQTPFKYLSYLTPTECYLKCRFTIPRLSRSTSRQRPVVRKRGRRRSTVGEWRRRKKTSLHVFRPLLISKFCQFLSFQINCEERTANTKSVLITTIIKSRKIYWFFGLCCTMDWGYKRWNPYRERYLAIFIKYFCLERTNQLNLLPDKDLVDLCPPIESYQVTKNR